MSWKSGELVCEQVRGELLGFAKMEAAEDSTGWPREDAPEKVRKHLKSDDYGEHTQY